MRLFWKLHNADWLQKCVRKSRHAAEGAWALFHCGSSRSQIIFLFKCSMLVVDSVCELTAASGHFSLKPFCLMQIRRTIYSFQWILDRKLGFSSCKVKVSVCRVSTKKKMKTRSESTSDTSAIYTLFRFLCHSLTDRPGRILRRRHVHRDARWYKHHDSCLKHHGTLWDSMGPWSYFV